MKFYIQASSTRHGNMIHTRIAGEKSFKEKNPEIYKLLTDTNKHNNNTIEQITCVHNYMIFTYGIVNDE